MSAFICSNYHVSVLAAAIKSIDNYPKEMTIEQVANLLYLENLKSVNYRYHESIEPNFEFDKDVSLISCARYSAIQLIKAAHYYQCKRQNKGI